MQLSQGNAETHSLLEKHRPWECKNGTASVKNRMESPQNITIELSQDPAISLLGVDTAKELEVDLGEIFVLCVYSSISFESPKVEAAAVWSYSSVGAEVCKVKRVLEVGCTTMGMLSSLLNLHLQMLTMGNFMLCILPRLKIQLKKTTTNQQKKSLLLERILAKIITSRTHCA